MPNSECAQGDVVRVPFPYTDRPVRQHRPALVVSNAGLDGAGALLWVVMITSAENRAWASDVPLREGYRDAGLPAPSLIRPAKIATIEASHAERLGSVGAMVMETVRAQITKVIALQSPTR